MENLSDFQLAQISKNTHDYTIIGKTIVNKDFTFRDPNPQLCKIFGLTPGDLKDKTFLDITPVLVGKIDALNARMMANKELTHYILPKPYQVETNSDKKIYALISVTPILKEDGEFECYYVEIMELTKQTYIKHTREMLKSHPELLANQLSFPGTMLAYLEKCSPEMIYRITLKIIVILAACAIGYQEAKQKAVELLEKLFS